MSDRATWAALIATFVFVLLLTQAIARVGEFYLCINTGINADIPVDPQKVRDHCKCTKLLHPLCAFGQT